MNQNTKRIMEQLDKWVYNCSSAGYVKPDFKPLVNYAIPEHTGIQQVRAEIEDFIDVLLRSKKRGSVLEIGLGYFGSTHLLWRLLFNRVITIEKSHERIREFGKNTHNFYKKWVLDDKKSSFIIGMSYEPGIVKKTYDFVKGGIDLLFIDADHKYESVSTDWLLYSPLVKNGGIVAFHDSAASIEGYYGAPKFINRLSKGLIDGQKYSIRQIIHSKHCGIAYYIKK